MTTDTPETTYLKDYTKPNYQITKTFLDFSIYDGYTRVKSKLECVADTPDAQSATPLILNGEDMTLISIVVNGNQLPESSYTVDESTLTVKDLPRKFTLEIETEICPETNKSCEGLYQSGDIFCTQNESQGFRRITYFMDRPDVMSIYTTRVEADKSRFPILLSNGNRTDSGDLADDRHFVVWEDPFRKPTYLFALVAGDLAIVEDSFTTCSGRTIPLQIFVDKGNEDRAQHSLDSLKSAMKWDEERFGLEYDLDIYMIVAVDSFNMGAMENKGLNIFNSTCALANPKTATDSNFQGVERVIAHEYFHNWTGNRITCRDWFQLTLKEGLTVFRDQEYSADTMSRPVHRIQTVSGLRNGQFVEDGGPLAHPIKPASYIEINNFYTNTVYSKGAEVIRMIQTLIGRDTFRKGMDKYVELFDGQAVTTEDFISAMEMASSMDLTQFRDTWYTQAGTPVVDVDTDYDASAQTYSITVKQSCRPTPECAEKKPYHLPILLGLLDASGNDLPLNLLGSDEPVEYLNLTKAEETFVFTGITEKPVPSLLRDFSAPVILNYAYSNEDLVFLLANDNDAFNRYEAGQRLATIELERLIHDYQNNRELLPDTGFIEALGTVLEAGDLDDALKAEALSLPSVTTLVERMDVCDYEAAWAARDALRDAIATTHESTFKSLYDTRVSFDGTYSVAPAEVGRRALQNTALSYLTSLNREDYTVMAVKQFEKATNMTDEFAAFTMLCQLDSPERKKAIDAFYQKWSSDSLVMNKWFATQASSRVDTCLADVKELANCPAFDATNPNKLRSLYGAFAMNTRHFHAADGVGYAFIADKIMEIDTFNPQVASRFAVCFRKYAKLDDNRKASMRAQMERILAKDGLSKDVFEIISKTLG